MIDKLIPRYTYKTLQTNKDLLLLRDDGYRWSFLILESLCHEPEEGWNWELLFEYKHCDLPGVASDIIKHLLGSLGDIK